MHWHETPIGGMYPLSIAKGVTTVTSFPTLFLATLLALILQFSCGSESETELAAVTEVNPYDFSCVERTKSHQGCCSAQDGFTDFADCEDPSQVKYYETGSLICKNGKLSPTCVR